MFSSNFMPKHVLFPNANRLNLASVVSSQYTQVTDRQTTDRRKRVMTIAELCNAIATFDKCLSNNDHERYF